MRVALRKRSMQVLHYLVGELSGVVCNVMVTLLVVNMIGVIFSKRPR